LRRISSELKLPEPIKARILLEMAADLEALYEHYCARGLAEEEAARLTEEKLLASPEALQHLIVVHTTGYQRWLGRAAERLRWGLDLLLFLLGVGPVVVIAAWVVAAEAERPLQGLLFWGVFSVVLGFLGTVIGIIQIAQAIRLLGQVEPPLVWAGFGVSLVTLIFGLLIFLIAALLWFVLRQWSWHRFARNRSGLPAV
jgi:hypothetical protein